jgi:hypothetical protein
LFCFLFVFACSSLHVDFFGLFIYLFSLVLLLWISKY